MYCENRFCVFWSNALCCLDRISLDRQGNCQCCVFVDLAESTLQARREADRELLAACGWPYGFTRKP